MDGDADCFCLDSTGVKVHPDGTRARKTNGPQSIGKSRGGWCAKIHMVSTSDWEAMIFRLSGGNAHDAPEGRALLESWAGPVANAPPAGPSSVPLVLQFRSGMSSPGFAFHARRSRPEA